MSLCQCSTLTVVSVLSHSSQTPEGNFWALDRDGKLLPRIHAEKGVLEDYVTLFNPDGVQVDHVAYTKAQVEPGVAVDLLSDRSDEA